MGAMDQGYWNVQQLRPIFLCSTMNISVIDVMVGLGVEQSFSRRAAGFSMGMGCPISKPLWLLY